MCGQLVVDRAHERFGAEVTIADLARYSFPDFNCNLVHIYEVWERLEEDWRFELDRDASTLEYATGVSARFKDGSTLHISAWADCCDGSGCVTAHRVGKKGLRWESRFDSNCRWHGPHFMS